MNDEQRKRAKNAILGAAVADAAALGMHWIYSQRRIHELAPETPEFREPSEADFADGVGYFAHAGKRAGDLSQYGEQMLVMLRSLANTQGRYQRADYTEGFRRHFGYGGEFVGYIDRPTRQTLDTIYRDENTAMEAVNALPYAGNEHDRHSMHTKVLAAIKQYEGEGLRDRVAWYADQMPDPDLSLDYGLALVDALAPSDEFPGAIDEQLPAVSKLPPLVACHLDDPALDDVSASAIRVTNNAPRALDFGRVCTELLRSAIGGASIESSVEAAVAAGSESAQAALMGALSDQGSVREVSKACGLHCDLGAGVPSLMHNLQSATSFTQAVRRNIAAGGDNCGRAVVLGAACGAAFGIEGDAGIPSAWLARVHRMAHIEDLVERILG